MQAARGTPLSGDTTQLPPAPARWRRLGVLAAIAAFVYALDQVSKIIAVRELTDRAPIELAGGILTLRLTRNSGAAFSIGSGATVVFSLVAVVVVVVILRTARRLGSLGWAAALGLLLGGALGNLTDRVLRAPGFLRGHVVDFLELPRWPVFNVADMAIVSSAAAIVLLSMLGRQLDGTRTPPRARD